MAFLQVQFFSNVLQVAVSVNVILPEGNADIGVSAAQVGKTPRVLYLLHGLSDDHSIWMRRTSVERYAAGQNLAVIMPAVNRSFYCNEACGERYWDYVSEELPQTMQRFFRLSDRPEDTFVAGLSMGGYGAMKLALTYPERFAAAGCFSGAADVAESSRCSVEGREKKARVFGPLEKIAGSENDLFHLLVENAGAPRKPYLYISCGTGDFRYITCRRLASALRQNGWNVTAYEKPDEGHNWRFWDEEIEKFIPWAMELDTEK